MACNEQNTYLFLAHGIISIQLKYSCQTHTLQFTEIEDTECKVADDVNVVA